MTNISESMFNDLNDYEQWLWNRLTNVLGSTPEYADYIISEQRYRTALADEKRRTKCNTI